jgi:hypothetical protein
MENVETKSGFGVAIVLATIVIGLLVLTSFVIFGCFQVQSKHLLDMYLAYLNTANQRTPVSIILRTVSLLF